MDPIKADLKVVKVDDTTWDVLVFAEKAVLKAFESTYTNGVFYVERSVFDNKPMIVVPAFPSQQHANLWKEYWIQALGDPDNSCKSCPTVMAFFDKVSQERSPFGPRRST